MSLDEILLLIGVAVIGMIAGILFGMLVQTIKTKIEKRTAQKIWLGKKPNVINVEGERIRIKKFKWKTPEGELMEHNIPQP